MKSTDAFLIRRLDARDPGFDAVLTALTAFEAASDPAVVETVARIIADVRRRGDAAVLEYTRRFDRVSAAAIDDLRLAPSALEAALRSLAPERRAALEAAADRIRRFHERQRQPSWTFTEEDGTRLGQRTTAIDRAGLYVPGGKAAYPSSVLMNAIPAQVAGVGARVMVVPTPEGERNPSVLAAARIAGIDEVWTIGGAQAVAALAFGTASITAVDKIVGPGNQWVAEAKRQVFGQVGIDLIAGPSEILVVADGSVPEDWVAMDLFAQAEHDEMAQAILVSPDGAYLDRVAAAIARLLEGQPRRAIIARSLADRGALIEVPDLATACTLVNRIAPEHLELAVADPAPLLERIRHAGAIFCGSHSSESLGDYCAGPSHVLPTMRTPRFSSPLGVYDFQKRSSLIDISAAGAARLGPIAATLARAESLEAHARSAEFRVPATARRIGDADHAAASAPTGLAETVAALARERVREIVRADVRAMSAYHVPPSTGLVKLDAMENPYGLPPDLSAELGRRLAGVAINRYPVPDYLGLKQRLRERFGLPDGAGIVLGNGSDELIALATAIVARPGVTVLSPQPSFVMYAMSAQQYGLRHVGVPLEPDFGIDLDAMLAAIEAECPALIFLAWPNNPTGNAFDRAAVRAIVEHAPGLVIVDEAYEPFAQASWVGEIASHPNLAVLRTLSKWGIAGVRLGYLVADPAWTEALEKLRPPYNIGVLNEAAANFALDHADVFAGQAASIRDERTRLLDRLRAMATDPGSLVETVFPTEANFVLVRFSERAGGAAGPAGPAGPDPGLGTTIARRLLEAGVLVKDAGRMHPLLANCLRLTVGTPDENRRLIEALARAAAR
jgi:histidinol dehydrogenase